MMGRWGLEGMRSFEQVGVAKQEGERLEQGAHNEAAEPVAATATL